MAFNTGKKAIPIYVDPSIHREILVYAAETSSTIQEVIKPMADEFIQDLLKLVSQIREMRRKAEIERLKQEEESKISLENPLIVSGHEVDPIGKIEIAQAVSS